MNFYVLLFVPIITFMGSSVSSSPTPSPQFPFTVLPPKGQGHRKPYRPSPGKKEQKRSYRVFN